MEHVTRSFTAMALAVLAALVYVLGLAFEVAAYAVLSPAGLGITSNFIHASDWLRLAGAVVAVLAVCVACWELVLRKAWAGVWEVSAAAVGILLVTIGLLINAASSQSSSASDVVSAVGIGVLALLVLSRAARRSLAEDAQGRAAGEGASPPPRQAVLWLVAAGGLAVLAIGSGFTPDISSTGLGITAGVLEAAGVAMLLGALAAARGRGYLASRAAPVVLAGLAVLTAAFAAFAIVSGLVLGPDATLTGIRVGVPIAVTIELAAVATLGLAAWTKVRELAVAPSP